MRQLSKPEEYSYANNNDAVEGSNSVRFPSHFNCRTDRR